MKKKIALLIFTLMLLLSSVGYCSDWTYAGRFVLRNNQQANVDIYLLNHLRPYTGQNIYTGSNSYSWFDVYFKHDHSTDWESKGEGYSNSITVIGNIVHLDINAKPMNYKGSFSGNIMSVMRVGAKGAYGADSKLFQVWDRVTQQLIFEAKGDAGHEILYADSALEKILNMSGPHLTIGTIRGSTYYPYY